MRNNIKKGDKIITMGGIYGTVQGIKDKILYATTKNISASKFFS